MADLKLNELQQSTYLSEYIGIASNGSNGRIPINKIFPFGLDVELSVPDLNSFRVNGICEYKKDTTLNAPSNYGVVLQISNRINPTVASGYWLFQLAFSTSPHAIYFRSSINGNDWSEWSTVYSA